MIGELAIDQFERGLSRRQVCIQVEVIIRVINERSRQVERLIRREKL